MPHTMEQAAHRPAERSIAAISALIVAAIVLVATRSTTQDHVGEIVSLVDISDQSQELCKALVVSPHLVLTAAHCTFHPEGGYRALVTISNNGELYETQTILYPTERYIPGDLGNDLALIRTREPVGTSQALSIDTTAPGGPKTGFDSCAQSTGLIDTNLLCRNTTGGRSGTPVLSGGTPIAVTVAVTIDQTIYTPLFAHAGWYTPLLSQDEPSSNLSIRIVATAGLAALAYLAVTLLRKRRRLKTSRTTT